MSEESSNQGGRSPLVGIAGVLAVAAVITVPLVGISMEHHTPALPQNKLECATSPSGYATLYDPTTTPVAVVFKNQRVRSVRTCTWEWPSEYVATEGTSYFENPPTVVTFASGRVARYSGNDELYISQAPLNLSGQ